MDGVATKHSAVTSKRLTADWEGMGCCTHRMVAAAEATRSDVKDAFIHPLSRTVTPAPVKPRPQPEQPEGMINQAIQDKIGL